MRHPLLPTRKIRRTSLTFITLVKGPPWSQDITVNHRQSIAARRPSQSLSRLHQEATINRETRRPHGNLKTMEGRQENTHGWSDAIYLSRRQSLWIIPTRKDFRFLKTEQRRRWILEHIMGEPETLLPEACCGSRVNKSQALWIISDEAKRRARVRDRSISLKSNTIIFYLLSLKFGQRYNTKPA